MKIYVIKHNKLGYLCETSYVNYRNPSTEVTIKYWDKVKPNDKKVIKYSYIGMKTTIFQLYNINKLQVIEEVLK